MPVEAPDVVDWLEDLWTLAPLPCEEDGCSSPATWLCRCPFDGCDHRVHLCDLHVAIARDVVLQLLASSSGFVGCPACLRKYPKQGPFRRWVHL